MANYCSNSVTFTGGDSGEALAHFTDLEYNSPPFLDISIYGEQVNFESRWVPPIRELNRLAEHFSVNYRLDYHIPYEDRASYVYTCLQQEALSPEAVKVRDIINRAATPGELAEANLMVRELIQYRTFDLHDLGLFVCALDHRMAQMGLTTSLTPEIGEGMTYKPWESNDPSGDRNRQR